MPFSGANLFAGLVFSSIGFVGFVFGKRLSLWKPMLIGLALMAYPYFIEDTLTLCASGWLDRPPFFGCATNELATGSRLNFGAFRP